MIRKDNRKFIFWQRWLLYSSLLFAFFGISLALFGGSSFFKPYKQALTPVFWHLQTLPPEADNLISFSMGPMGGTIACCYILLVFLARGPFRNKELWSRNAIIVAFGLWYILDSAVCIYYGVLFQAYVINTVSLLQKLLPIVFTWSDFKRKGKQ